MNLRTFIVSELVKPMRSKIDNSFSSSDDEEYTQRTLHNRIRKYVENTVPKYCDIDFKQHFRMERSNINLITQFYGRYFVPKEGGWPQVYPDKAVLMTVWYLANTETFRQISDRFDVTLSCAHNIIKLVTQLLVRLSKDFITWHNQNSAETDSQIFANKKGISNVIGAIDCTHIRINRPKLHQEDYCNRKGYHSIIVQGVVNSTPGFLDISVGEPGSMHDARVLRRSILYKQGMENPDSLFYGYKLLGDSAYPSLHWLMTPTKDNGHLSNEEKEFNYRHSSTRIIIETAFGHLKGRFRRLQKFDNFNVSFIVNCVAAACVLHKICQPKHDLNDEVFIDEI